MGAIIAAVLTVGLPARGRMTSDACRSLGDAFAIQKFGAGVTANGHISGGRCLVTITTRRGDPDGGSFVGEEVFDVASAASLAMMVRTERPREEPRIVLVRDHVFVPTTYYNMEWFRALSR